MSGTGTSEPRLGSLSATETIRETARLMLWVSKGIKSCAALLVGGALLRAFTTPTGTAVLGGTVLWLVSGAAVACVAVPALWLRSGAEALEAAVGQEGLDADALAKGVARLTDYLTTKAALIALALALFIGIGALIGAVV